MIWLYFKSAVRLILCFLGVSVLMIVLGHTQPLNPALAGFREGCEDKSQPCWYGIVPYQSTYEQALDLLAKRGFRLAAPTPFQTNQSIIVHPQMPSCQVRLGEYMHKVDIVWLINCPTIYLGEIIALFNPPETVLVCEENDPPIPMYLYKSGINLDVEPGTSSWLSPYHKIMAITIRGGSDLYGHIQWRGFVRLWRYKQLEPNFIAIPCHVET
jgi:hypothetical protein